MAQPAGLEAEHTNNPSSDMQRQGLHVFITFPSKCTEFLSSTHPRLISLSREVAQLFLESRWHTAISSPCSNVWDLFPWPETHCYLKPSPCASAPNSLLCSELPILKPEWKQTFLQSRHHRQDELQSYINKKMKTNWRKCFYLRI